MRQAFERPDLAELREALCPRCGGDAQWSFADEAKTEVVVACADCGRYTLPRAEFDAAEAEIATPEERL